MARSDVLRSVHRVLESYEPLASYLEHVEGASTILEGARITGDTVLLNGVAPPLLILSFDEGDADAPSREHKHWGVDVYCYGSDIFEAADLIDLVEAACLGYRNDGVLALPQRLLRIRPNTYQRVFSEQETSTVVEVRFSLGVEWIQEE